MTELDSIAQPTEAQAIIDVMTDLQKPEMIDATDEDGNIREIYVAPKGMTLHSMKKFHDEYATKPERRTGTANLVDLDSYIDHVNRHKNNDSVQFSNINLEKNAENNSFHVRAHIQCVFDYNPAGEDGEKAGNCQHRARYDFPTSPEIDAWFKNNVERMDTLNFAEFLEDRIVDVMHVEKDNIKGLSDNIQKFIHLTGGIIATPQKLLELSRGLKLNSEETVHQAINLSSGEATVQFNSKHTDNKGAAVKIPNVFLIAIPLFKNGAAYQIAVRLRYRTRGGSISWHYEMYRPELSLDHAFDEALALAANKTELLTLKGAPEL